MEFTQDELETISDLISDWGFEYSLSADSEKVEALRKKLEEAGVKDWFDRHMESKNQTATPPKDDREGQ